MGALYIKNGVSLIPTYYGGGQEKDLRPGTENIAYIHGMSIALEIAMREQEEWHDKLYGFESLFLDNLKIMDEKIFSERAQVIVAIFQHG